MDPALQTNLNPVIFDLQVEDGDLLSMIRKPLTESQAYWEGTFGLKKVRDANMNLWLPNHWKDKQVYDYQEDYLYQDPKVFIAVETICSVVNSRIPSPDVMPGQDNIISRQVASDLQRVLYAHGGKYRVADLFRLSTRNLLLKRIGYIKLRFDPTVGEYGDIVPEFVLPEDVVVDQDARYGETPRFMAQYIRNKTAEELIALFPDARQGIYKLIGTTRTDSKGNLVAYKSMLSRKLNLWEVWFRYYDAQHEQFGGGLAYVDEKFQVVLGKMRNPNWNYDDETVQGKCSNLLDSPAPPFIPINYLNDGSSYIDLTTMVEQSASLQRILDRRGFQIMDNAEQTGSGLVFNTLMIKKEDIAKLTGSPDERIGVKGPVNQAVMRVAPPVLPQYVIEDKMDARGEIDNVFATHDITRGENSGAKTLGQDQMQQGQDYTRMDDITRAVERQATLYYRYLVQMIKVYWTEEHWLWAAGEDGQFDHVMMRADMIEDGVDVTVEANSTLPPRKKEQMALVNLLAPLGMIDPLSMYEVGAGGTLPSPKKMLERLVKWKTDPNSFLGDTQKDDVDRQALMDIQTLLRGEEPSDRDDITPEYLKFFNNYITSSGQFMKQSDKIKTLFADWGRKIYQQAEQQMELMMTQMPSPEDMNNANQQALAQHQLEAQMGGGQPPAPGGAPASPPAPGGMPMPAPAPSGAPAGAAPMQQALAAVRGQGAAVPAHP